MGKGAKGRIRGKGGYGRERKDEGQVSSDSREN